MKKKNFPILERRKTVRAPEKSDDLIVFEELKDLLHTISVVRKKWRDNTDRKEDRKLFEPLLLLYGILGDGAENYSRALYRLKKNLKKAS